MMSSAGPETDRQLWDLLLNSFVELEPESAEAVQAQLSEFGIQPEESGKGFATIAANALRKSPFDWRQRAHSERGAALSRRAQARVYEGLEADVLLAMVRKRASTGMRVHHRNLEESTAEDLATLLADWDFIESEDK